MGKGKGPLLSPTDGPACPGTTGRSHPTPPAGEKRWRRRKTQDARHKTRHLPQVASPAISRGGLRTTPRSRPHLTKNPSYLRRVCFRDSKHPDGNTGSLSSRDRGPSESKGKARGPRTEATDGQSPQMLSTQTRPHGVPLGTAFPLSVAPSWWRTGQQGRHRGGMSS